MTAGKVVFYQLGRKFMDRKEDVPAEAKQVVYYSLAIGHHIGVIDCLQPILECPLPDFEHWLTRFAQGPARGKLEGLLKFGEINIDSSHITMLASALDKARPDFDARQQQWADQLMRALHDIAGEPAIYLIARRRDPK